LSFDGGHLIDLGKRLVAKGFVHAMAGALNLSPKQQSVRDAAKKSIKTSQNLE